MALLGPLIWAVSFAEDHPYSNPIYFFWESAAMGAMFLLLVASLARLKGARTRADERMKALLDAMPVCAYIVDRSGTVVYANRQLHLLCRDRAMLRKESDIADAVEAGSSSEFELAMGGVRASAHKVHPVLGRPRYRLHRAAFSAGDGDSLTLVSLIEVGAN